MLDPVEEIHRRREEHDARLNRDIDAIFDELKRLEDEDKARGVKFVTLKPRRPMDLRAYARRVRARMKAAGVEPWHDPIIEEIHRIRENNAAKFGYDVKAIAEDARKRQATSGHKVVDLSKRKPRRKSSVA